MAKLEEYIVNIQLRDGDNEVHRLSCEHLPNVENQHYLGAFDHSSKAVMLAKLTYPNSDGCFHCCPESHTS